MKAILERFAKLIDVKSLVTLSLTGVFCALSFKGVVPREFLSIYMLVIGFYFGNQIAKKKDTATGTSE